MGAIRNNILMEIFSRQMSVGGPLVHRYLPFAKKRMVGPFIFFDYFPATEFAAGSAMDVRPHPHIGLSTMSYLLEGEVLHHDSLGHRQILRPGEVNWMTAGRGISHSERLPEALRGQAHRLHLLQFWVALPKEQEDCEPFFTHYAHDKIPQFQVEGVSVFLIAGQAFGQRSPVNISSPLFFMDVQLKKNQVFSFNPDSQELAIFVLNGSVQLDEKLFGAGSFVVLEQGSYLNMVANEDSQVIVLGGEPFPEKRHVYWNFVSSSRDKIEAAKATWKDGSFPQVPGEPDVIPLPEET